MVLIPVTVSVVSLALALWNTRSNTKDKAETQYVNSLEGELKLHKARLEDLEKRMRDCELARDELARKNHDLLSENTTLLRKIVEEGVISKLRGGDK